MRFRGRLLIVLLVGITVSPLPASGDTLSGGGASAYVDDDGNPTASASDQVQITPVGGGSSSDATNCEWQVVTEDDTAFGVFDSDGERLHSETGRWLQRVCDGQLVAVGDAYVVPESTTEVQPQTLAAEAVRSVRIAPPSPATSPAADETLYTQVPTWLWLDEDWWRDYQATARAGGVTSTVTARPLRARWSAGDGGGTTCGGPGVAWQRGLAEGASDCRYEYRRSSAGEPVGSFTLSVTVDFEITWSSNVGESGRLPGITRSASREVRVSEIQAIETG